MGAQRRPELESEGFWATSAPKLKLPRATEADADQCSELMI
jgi:hypothetical protein